MWNYGKLETVWGVSPRFMNDRVNMYEHSILIECLIVDILIYELMAAHMHFIFVAKNV